jgi:hypothetical protein
MEYTSDPQGAEGDRPPLPAVLSRDELEELSRSELRRLFGAWLVIADYNAKKMLEIQVRLLPNIQANSIQQFFAHFDVAIGTGEAEGDIQIARRVLGDLGGSIGESNGVKRGVRRGKVLIFSGCKSHLATGSLQPVAIGAAVEETKPSEPSRQTGRLATRRADRP